MWKRITKSICLICVVTLTLSGCKQRTDVEASLHIEDGFFEIAHGGYFQLSYEGKTWTEDFGSGYTPSCTFRDIELKWNKKANIKVCIKNGWGVVTWTKEEEFNLYKGTSHAIIFVKSRELK